ncbi:MAG: branched-chain amino acid ABC transporter permease [Bdellovibrionales bacterium]|nr:branched-chain amino acid ABC transporter permease [Bdellovibrionales bacterium]
MEYLIHLAILVGIYLILAQSFNVTFGLGGLFNLAHVAVYAIGAYTTALLSTEYSYGPLFCIPASMLLSALFALLIGAISLKLSHDYFAIGSLAFSAVVTAVLINWKSLTRGVLGIPGIPRPDFLGVDYYDNANFLLLVGVLVVVTYVVLWLVFQSSFSRRLRAQAEHPHAAQSLGIDIKRVRNESFMISSLFAGLAGSLFAYYINYIDPSSFGLHEMVFVLSIAIVGRPGSFWGVTFAAVFLVLLPEPLRFIEISPAVLGPMRQLLYALILFAVVWWKRETLFPSQRVV